jgi:hypothetical protein
LRWCCSKGNPKSRSPESYDGDAHRFLPVRHRFWSSHWLEVVLRHRGVSLPTSTMLGLCGVVPRQFGGGCVLCCVCMEEEPSGAVVASMAR